MADLYVCGSALEPIDKEFVQYEFRFTPAKGEVVNIYREIYKCPVCSTADAMEENIKFVKSAVLEPLIINSYASGTTGSYIVRIIISNQYIIIFTGCCFTENILWQMR